MQIIVLTLFPEMFSGPFDHSIVKRAASKNRISLTFVNIRDFAKDSHKTVDDRPYGGGVGMILKVDVVDRALSHAKHTLAQGKTLTVLLDPGGDVYTQSLARKFSLYETLIILCGHYEGIDDRIRTLVDMELSIGDYVLTGGEIPAMVLIDSVVRLLPGVLGKDESTLQESFSDPKFIEHPQFTRPPTYLGMNVPQTLLSGNHKDIENWRKQESQKRTQKKRPDLN